MPICKFRVSPGRLGRYLKNQIPVDINRSRIALARACGFEVSDFFRYLRILVRDFQIPPRVLCPQWVFFMRSMSRGHLLS